MMTSSVTMVQWSKPENYSGVTQTFSESHQFSLQYFFVSVSHIAVCCYSSLVSSNLWQTCSLFLSFMKNTRQLFSRIILNLGLYDVFLWFKWSYAFLWRMWGKSHHTLCSAQHWKFGNAMFLEWSHFYLEYVDKLGSAGFLHCKVAVFPFVISKHLRRDTLRLYKCPVCPHFYPLILVLINESCLQQLLLWH